ncbi:MAG: protein kinase, partial [Acidobacteriota bacterium]
MPDHPDARARHDAPSTPRPRRYQTAVPLARGATSEVFRAFDVERNRAVALKFLLRDDPALVERMLREAEAQARIEHPGICTIYDVGTWEGRPYIAMELIEGEELGAAAAHLDVDALVELMRQTAEAVGMAHANGLVHRDLKPSNIMVTRRDDGTLRAVVVDFGLVREHALSASERPLSSDLALTHDGRLMGTPPYLAPEQVRGDVEQVGPASDVYGLGATFYQAFTGQPPFDGAQRIDVLRRILEDDPPPPRRLQPALPRDLETILQTCLEKSPARRYASAGEVGADLVRMRRGTAIVARRRAAAARAGRRLMRHRLMVVSLAILVAIGAALAFSLHMRQRDDRLARERFGGLGRDLAGIMRAEHMAAAHDLRPAKARVRAQLAPVREALDDLGGTGRAAAHYALGRGHLALREDEMARHHLARAWSLGYRTPDAAYALGSMLGRRYQAALEQARQAVDPSLQTQAIERADARFRDETLARLRDAQRGLRPGAASPGLAGGPSAPSASAAYIEALLAFHDGQLTRAVEHARAAQDRPWRYEAWRLEGDILRRLGFEASERGEIEAALAHYDEADAAYRRARDTAGSDPWIHTGLCALYGHRMRLEGRVPGQPLAAMDAARERALDACGQARAVDPDLATPVIRETVVHMHWSEYLFWRTDRDPGPTLWSAQRLARQAVALAPRNADAYAVRGSADLRYGWYLDSARPGADARPFYDRAIATLHRALDQRGDSALVLNMLGRAHERKAAWALGRGLDPTADLERATRALERVAVLAPGTFMAHYNLGRAYDQRANHAFGPGSRTALGRADVWNERARSAYARALGHRPDHAWTLSGLADADGRAAWYRTLRGGDGGALIVSGLEHAARGLDAQPTL